MILVTPLITPLAVQDRRRGGRSPPASALAAVGFGRWRSCRRRGRTLCSCCRSSRSPSGSGSRTARRRRRRRRPSPPDQVGQASGISNMARYIGGSPWRSRSWRSIYNAVIDERRRRRRASQADALAEGLSRAAIVMVICAVFGVGVGVLLMARHRGRKPRAVDRAAARRGDARTRSRPSRRSPHPTT